MEIIVNTNRTEGKVKKYWTKCVGSGHAALALREDWREQLKKCREELGFEYVRFHGLFDDDMSVCTKKDDGTYEYSFFNVDSIFDFILEIGMKPFVELSFMPEALASGAETVFHYKGNITPPRSYDEWANLVGTLAMHLVERYGAREVRQWFFEVWNEPNLDLFWTGSQEEYFRLYEYSALAIKKIDPLLAVGGPSTAIDAWIPELKEYCWSQDIPLDFISTHHYPTDAAYGLGLNMEEQMARSERGVLSSQVNIALEEADPLPLYYTEWNNSPSPRDPYHDTSYNAAFIIKTITENSDTLNSYSFWTFTDIFEECGFSSIPFHGGFGLLNIHGIPKPSYRAFELLSQFNGEKLKVDIKGMPNTIDCAASHSSEGIFILITNHQIPLSPIKTETIKLRIYGIKEIQQASMTRIDKMHANPKEEWKRQGSPSYLNEKQIEDLVKASDISWDKVDWDQDGEDTILDLTCEPHSVIAISLS